MKKAITLALLIIMQFSNVQAGVYNGPTTDQKFTELLNQVTDKRAQLVAKMEAVKAAGYSTDYAQVSIVTIDLFKDKFAPWDRANPEQVQAMYDAKSFGRFDPVGPIGLPFDELADCLEVADAAIAELDLQLEQQIKLTVPPNFAKTKLELIDDTYQLDDQKVFASKFFWQPIDEEVLQAFGRGGESYYSANDLDSEFEVKNSRRSYFIDRVEGEVESNRAPLQFFLGHTVPSGGILRQNYPQTFADGYRTFTDYDIDDPNVRIWLDNLFEKQLKDGVEAASELERVHMIANEPTFAIAGSGNDHRTTDGVTQFTMDKYRQFLITKYDTIEKLNQVYQTNHASFSAATSQYTIPLAHNYRGGPVWYDWHIFNLERVNDWFTYLHNGVHSVDSNAKTHVKILGERSVHYPDLSEGIDFEYVTNLVDIPGTDSQMSSYAAEWNLRYSQGWRDRSSIEWRSQSIMLDFMKSIAPEKHLYDSEWHAFSGSRWRDYHMSPEYVRATIWLGVTHGLGSVTTWVWNRKADGSIDNRADFIGTSVTQPIQLDAYGRAIKEVNAHGNDSMSLTPDERKLMLFYNKDTVIQDDTYTLKLTDVYEALKLTNAAVGFVTPSTLANINKDEQVVVVSPTTYMSDSDFNALQNFADNDGQIVLVTGNDDFAMTEIGKTRSNNTLTGTLSSFSFSNVLKMSQLFESHLASADIWPELQIVARNSAGERNYGVLVSQLKKEDGKYVTSLINTSQQTLFIDLTAGSFKPISIKDKISQNTESNGFEMKPMDVRFLELSSALESNVIEVDSIALSSPAQSLKVEETLALKVAILPIDATNQEVLFSSSDESIASVDLNGMVKALAVGDVTISVVAKNTTKSAQISLKVEAKETTNDNSSNTDNNQQIQLPEQGEKSSGGSQSILLVLIVIGFVRAFSFKTNTTIKVNK
ncbi:Ig-like domain-containing protein [Thalassomonas sp. M1454]|uniref:Ig-like domain-containing protein n=1 Tax=Thalassomonas sp. M1454 TaxID=2594477 RepID=UPI0011801D30|nr:Ig-like domain-containing protein [Thalassomonas sp. M1454]TRX57981.1 Ig-like domain-containing protein [Thalassomonas sp. M1454]